MIAKYCIKCGKARERNESICLVCGTPITTYDINRSAFLNIQKKTEIEPGIPETKTCPSCGEVLKSSVKFCSECGYSFVMNKRPVLETFDDTALAQEDTMLIAVISEETSLEDKEERPHAEKTAEEFMPEETEPAESKDNSEEILSELDISNQELAGNLLRNLGVSADETDDSYEKPYEGEILPVFGFENKVVSDTALAAESTESHLDNSVFGSAAHDIEIKESEADDIAEGKPEPLPEKPAEETQHKENKPPVFHYDKTMALLSDTSKQGNTAEADSVASSCHEFFSNQQQVSQIEPDIDDAQPKETEPASDELPTEDLEKTRILTQNLETREEAVQRTSVNTESNEQKTAVTCNADVITCKTCGYLLRNNEIYCPSCGTKKQAEAQSDPVKEEKATNATELLAGPFDQINEVSKTGSAHRSNPGICMKCGCRLQVGNEFCRMCGAPVMNTSSVNKDKATNRVCKKCCMPLKEQDVFCMKCGTSTNGYSVPFRADKSTQRTFCLKCGAEMSASDKFCMVCGSPVYRPGTNQKQLVKQKCLKCGSPMNENDQFCPICGTPAGALERIQPNDTVVLQPEMTSCLQCGSQMKKSDKFCMICGTRSVEQ